MATTTTTLGYLGLGKMGLNMALRLGEKGINVVAWNRGEQGRISAREKGVPVVDSIADVVKALPTPRTVWLMVPSGAVNDVVAELLPLLSRGDTIIDGGNCYFKETIARSKIITKKGIAFLDAGVSGGPGGARNGACVMVGGTEADFKKYEPLFAAIAAPGAVLHAGAIGAGHFIKMVHNGIEYGMMQALAEGFAVLKKSKYNLDLKKVAGIYNNKSVIESRLVGWLQYAYEQYGFDLKSISGSVDHTGEGAWTVQSAKELKIPVPIIEGSLTFRKKSAKTPSYTGKVLSALRNQFGGHDIAGPKKKTVPVKAKAKK